MATCSSILAWEISWTEESGRLQSMGHRKSDTTWQLNNPIHEGEASSPSEGPSPEYCHIKG